MPQGFSGGAELLPYNAPHKSHLDNSPFIVQTDFFYKQKRVSLFENSSLAFLLLLMGAVPVFIEHRAALQNEIAQAQRCGRQRRAPIP